MQIEISQLDSRLSVSIDGMVLPGVFSGYRLKSSDSGESELALIIKGDVNVAAISAKTET
jgi:hypothetical protein